RRHRVGWDDFDEPVPRRVRTLADDVWSRLQPRTQPDGDGAGTRLALDPARGEYAAMYAEAEALSQSSVPAAKRQRRKPAPVKAPPPSLYVRLARRVPAR